jgi:flagellar hook assembly protein FlgD
VVYAGWYVDDVMLVGAAPAGIMEQEPNKVLITTLNTVKPNPVTNGLAHISFSIAEPTKASLNIYDASGRLVRTLLNSKLNAGNYNLSWNGTDDHNNNVAEGIYFYTLTTDNNNFTKKLVFTR